MDPPGTPGRARPSLDGFLRLFRSQQALLLAFALAFYWLAVPLYFTSFRYFVYAMIAANLVFAVSMAYDALLIGEAQTAAQLAAVANPALGHALGDRLPWRWRAFWVNIAGCAFTVVACQEYYLSLTLLVVEADGVSGQASSGYVPKRSFPAAARHDAWLGDLLFELSWVCFTAGFAVLAADALLTMHQAARLLGLPEPSPWAEPKLLLASFGASLLLMSAGNALILAPGPLTDAVGTALGGIALAWMTATSAWELAVLWRDYVAGVEKLWSPARLEVGLASGPVLRGDAPPAGKGEEGEDTPLLS